MASLYRLRGETLKGITVDNEVPLEESNDAFDLRGSDNELIDCFVFDTRCRTSGHCDRVQLIPEGLEPNSQYFGAIGFNNKIIGGGLFSNGSMQSIFQSDGCQSNLYIADQISTTESEHNITINGLLSGTFKNNVDEDSNPVKITLEPARIGGGLPNSFYVLSFKDHTYEPINTDQEIQDFRSQKLARYPNANYVYNFDLNLFREISESRADQYQSIQQHFDDCLAEYERRSNGFSKDELSAVAELTKGNDMTKIAFIVGHNATSQGAVRQGVTEFKYWSNFFDDNFNELQDSADENAIQIEIFEREYFGRRTYGKEMRDVHSKVDQWGADISVECHYNGFNGKADGHEVLYLRESKGGKLIAGLFDQAMDEFLQNKDRDRKPVSIGENGSYGLKVGKAKSILIEPFFGQEISEFLPNGSQYENLLNSFKRFFELVNNQ